MILILIIMTPLLIIIMIIIVVMKKMIIKLIIIMIIIMIIIIIIIIMIIIVIIKIVIMILYFRAGRCRAGYCYHLFSSIRYDSLQDYQDPEILRYPLQELCLHTKLLAPLNCPIADFLAKAPEAPAFLVTRNAVTLLKVGRN